MKKKIIIFFMLFFLCTVISACSDEDGKGTNTATLEITEQFVDFKENGESQTLVITTNQAEWSATVESNGKSWCSILPDINPGNHKLTISVTPNTGKEQRSTIITVKAAELSEKITVRQLGTDKGILISPMMKTFTAEGGKIEFTVTANVEFEIIPTVDWITLPVTTRTAEYVTTDHTYFIQRNKGEKRTGTITVKDKASDLFSELIISQEALGEYESGESGIQGDLLVPVSTGSAFNSLGKVSQLGSSGFHRTYDGSKETGYHSNTSDDFPNNWPLTLTFEFAEQPRIDYCVCHSTGSDKLKKAKIFVSTEAEPEYTKLMDVDLSGSSAALIKFPSPIINPKGIKIEVTESSGKYLVIKEMEFYRQNSDNYDPLNLFTDITCSELKPGITEKDIDACPDPLFRNVAFYLSINKYPREFRIQEYKAYPHPELFRKANKTSAEHNLLDNPTGIFVNKGKEVVVLVGDSHGYQLSARILNLNVSGGDGFNYNYSYPLVEGINRFIAETDGLIYIYYHTPEYRDALPIKIHIPSGQVNGYFDSGKHQPSDWSRLLHAAVGPHLDVLGEKAHLIFPVDKFKANTPDGKALIDAYDRLVLLEQQFMGLEKYDRMDPNRVCFSVMYNDSYMYSAGNHTGYVVGTMNELCNLEKFSTTSIWGPAHEVGHSYQTKPGLCWLGMTEVTNNIHSLYVQTSFGNQSRLLDKQGDYTSIYEKSMCMYFVRKRAHIITDSDVNVFNLLVPFWQLYLYTKAIGQEDFYKDLYELIRINTDQDTPGKSQLEFTFLASKASGLDLTEFFVKWGFFEPIDIEKSDYSKGQFVVTESMIDETKQRITDLGLPKPKGIIEYICDSNVDCYKTFNSIIKGTAQREGQKIVMTNWRNVAVYEVYSNGKLCFVSPASSFTVNGNLGTKVQVFAVSATGEKVEVTF